jgi:mono/diheme cytochrome c family protein
MASNAKVLLAVGTMLALIAGCKKSPPPPAPAPATAQVPAPVAPVAKPPAVEARQVFDTRCVVCHGTHGKGDGPGAAALNPKPRAFGDPAWQKSAEDARIAKTIVEGGAATGLSPGMAPNPDLQSKPEVVAELVKIVRKFAEQP